MKLRITANQIQAGDQLYFNGRSYGTATGEVDTYEDLGRDFIHTSDGSQVLLSWEPDDHAPYSGVRPYFYVDRPED